MTRDFILDLLARVVLPLVVVAWGVRIYRWQRRFDRRVDWYVGTHRAIERSRVLFHKAAWSQNSEPPEAAERQTKEAIESAKLVSEQLADGFLFGQPPDHAALMRFTAVMKDEYDTLRRQGNRILPDNLDRITTACLTAAFYIAEGCRKELLLKPRPRLKGMPNAKKGREGPTGK